MLEALGREMFVQVSDDVSPLALLLLPPSPDFQLFSDYGISTFSFVVNPEDNGPC